MTDYQQWLDRIDNLLQVQRDRCLDLISANFTRRELIELKMMIEVLMEKVLEGQEPKTDVLDSLKEEITNIEICGQVDSYTSFIRTGEQVKELIIEIIDKYRQER